VTPRDVRFKRDDAGNPIFYNRIMPSTDPPFMTVNLPDPVRSVVGSVYELLCHAVDPRPPNRRRPRMCPTSRWRDGTRHRGARNCDARRPAPTRRGSRTVAFTPRAPLGTRHRQPEQHRIHRRREPRPCINCDGMGSAQISATAGRTTVRWTCNLSPSASRQPGRPQHLCAAGACVPYVALAPVWHGVANASLILYLNLSPVYTSFRGSSMHRSPRPITPGRGSGNQLTA
jgi:hypothetical protein